MTTTKPQIVAIGGGTGCPTVLRGLKSHPVDLTAIVTTMDSGGSSGRLRSQYGAPALGDLRRALEALAGEGHRSASQAALSEYRFGGSSDLAGHSLGNLLLLALSELHGGIEGAVDQMAELVSARGRVLPVTLQTVDLHARLQDGAVLKGEAAIDQRGHSRVGIDRVWLSPAATANPRAVAAIREADALVLGPGDLYTSLLPNLLVEGIPEAVRASRATTIFIANLATKPGETEGYRLSDFLRTVLEYLGSPGPFDTVVLDDADGGAAGGGENPPVEQDVEQCGELARRFLRRPIARPDAPWLHDPARIADAVMEAVTAGA